MCASVGTYCRVSTSVPGCRVTSGLHHASIHLQGSTDFTNFPANYLETGVKVPSRVLCSVDNARPYLVTKLDDSTVAVQLPSAAYFPFTYLPHFLSSDGQNYPYNTDADDSHAMRVDWKAHEAKIPAAVRHDERCTYREISNNNSLRYRLYDGAPFT